MKGIFNEKRFLIILLALSTTVACKKDKDIEESSTLTGTYKGQFITGAQGSTVTNDVKVIFEGEYFTTIHGPLPRATQSSGNFEITGPSTIAFYNNTPHFTETYVTDRMLTGEGIYKIKGDSLILNAKILQNAMHLPILYEYRLKRTK